jgi:hypothetical protein
VRILKEMVFMVTESKGGCVNLVSILLVAETHDVNRLGSRYGLNVG